MTTSHRAKFDRARKHFDVLERAERGEEPDAYRVAIEPDPDGGSHSIRVGNIDSDFLSCVIGDCVHNLRCSLDHLVLELALATKKSRPPNYEENCSFPIYGPYAMPVTKEEALLGPLRARPRSIIKNLQPHCRGAKYADDPLWKLHELDRIDKHRRLHVVVSKASGLGVGGSNVSVEALDFTAEGEELKPGASLGGFAVAPFEPEKKMNVKVQVRSEIAFEQGTAFPNQLVVPLLEDLFAYVEHKVIARLAKYL